MAKSTAKAHWEGKLQNGRGGMALGSGVLEADFSFGTRFKGDAGTNPEELIGAALAGCFSMALSGNVGEEGATAERIDTSAEVHLEEVAEGFAITRIDLVCTAKIPGIDDAKFQELAQRTKQGCPVSKALGAVQISLTAKLQS